MIRHIKKIIIGLACCILLHFVASAQNGKLPPFQMLLSNGKVFKAQHLPMGKPIIMVYFSPNCEHCETVTKQLVNNQAVLKKASIAMITYLSITDVNRFVKKFTLNQFDNIYVGTEGNSFFVRNYYKIKEMPFVALHNKNGDFIQSYSKEIDIKNLIKKVQSLK